MSKYKVGSQVQDIRNGKYHIIIDNETFDDLSLYYTSGGTSVPEYFLISTDKSVLSSLFERQQNDEVITEWLKENTELKDIVPVKDFDFDKFQRFDYCEMVCDANKSCESTNRQFLDSIEVA